MTKNSINNFESITTSSFAKLLGVNVNDLPRSCVDYINKQDFRYSVASGDERETLLLKAVKIVDSGNLSISGKHKKDVWEKGWKENFEEFSKSNNISDLIPRFVRKNQPVRLGGKDYIYPQNSDFETNFVTILRMYLFQRYLFNIKEIHEFGCGTGLNLVSMAELFPNSILNGYDWVQSSVEILSSLNMKYGFNITGHLFDMFEPNANISLDNGGVFTIGAMEQLGSDYKKFLRFLIEKKPSIVINVETIYELYNPNLLFDYVSLRYLSARNWLKGYYSDLLELEKEELIKIHDVRRTFGSFFHDGYTFIVWEPIA